uniref:Uncharacterized protein n=1 Tax=Anguilla anguilla TaxID=7936 RepID=A0A0E9X5I3_ANGAN
MAGSVSACGLYWFSEHHKVVVWWSSPRLSVHIILLLLASAEYSLDTPFKIICVELVSSHAPVHLETMSSCTNMTFT